MREILFRGKREDNGEWIEGYLVRRPAAIQVGDRSSPWAIDRPPNDPDDSGEVCFVDAGTVGQFTGLTDKNGRKIFEGDVVRMFFEDGFCEIGPIVWSSLYARCVFLSPDRVPYGLDQTSSCEIIGNIYGNHDLLEVEGDES